MSEFAEGGLIRSPGDDGDRILARLSGCGYHLPSGIGLAVNDTGQPERVLTSAELAELGIPPTEPEGT